jgi:uncharacterized membrane protein/glutaredoxin
MSRRRQQIPWIHRWARPLLGAIAILGAINTGYITLTKLLGGETACPTNGCEQVLSSAYASVFGLPLALFGFLAYVSMATFALAPLAVKPEHNKQLRSDLEDWTWLLLFVGSTAMLVFSAYLMYIMASVFVANYGMKGVCLYCIASAIFAFSLFVLTLIGRTWEDLGQLLLTGTTVMVVVLVGTLGVYAKVPTPGQAQTPHTAGQAPLQITTTSGESEIALARHLGSIGAKMYSAYWCPHCHDQKQLFGLQAFRSINYVECAPDGENSQASVCQANSAITGYPTWEINGQYLNGTQTLEALADASGYQGSRNFRQQ